MTLVFETPYERRGCYYAGLARRPEWSVIRFPAAVLAPCKLKKTMRFACLTVKGCNRWKVGVFRPRWYIRRRHAGGRKIAVRRLVCKRRCPTAALPPPRFCTHLIPPVLIWDGRKRFVFLKTAQKAGDMAIFYAANDGLLIVHTPAEAMSPEEQNPPTEVTLYIRRANPPEEKGGHTPPPPLADPLCDINILPGNAKSYEVKAGQYIQVLDVQGRECSNFQALSRRALDKGLEREIDPTTTRSLMGNLYPAPGIYSKYFSMDPGTTDRNCARYLRSS